MPNPAGRVSEGASIMELLVATAFGVPKPQLPYFESGKGSDFVLLNMALENLLISTLTFLNSTSSRSFWIT